MHWGLNGFGVAYLQHGEEFVEGGHFGLVGGLAVVGPGGLVLVRFGRLMGLVGLMGVVGLMGLCRCAGGDRFLLLASFSGFHSGLCLQLL